MSTAHPPTGTGALAKREARLAWGLLAPTLISVALVVVLPLLAVFWISFKPFTLSDLRPPAPIVRESLRGSGEEMRIEYRVRNSSQDEMISGVTLSDQLPEGVALREALPEPCRLEGRDLFCDFGEMAGGARERLRLRIATDLAEDVLEEVVEGSAPVVTGGGQSVLSSPQLSLENYKRLFDGGEFWTVFGITLFYTVFGTIGALVMGLFAALLLNKSFKGQGFIRGLYLFPYVAPVIAVAFTWVTLFDPFSGSANALLIQMGVTQEAINFFGDRPLALIMVTVFEIWRYFPLSFLFILARMQSIDTAMYEAADMDGASPFQKFWLLSLPQLLGILSVLFLLRFIWTFNKFDDIFLLTGGNAGTRTLTVNVYEQAFAISNIGAGAAVAVVILLCLLCFSFFFFKFISREEGL
ncbi:carbohydrate ABC transporter permease [Shimia marina]|uniref:Inner membrane ABC transporter permease protein YcjO n=1 Tax=Shimia marina TaxID=321267 RepID=A0A0P1FDS5_9RHOB|nr:sugar ABC transporter permease [Shimia marina]CUH52022.1 Inner membrane ABC transporter permease protein YcjO [Shimia marina]SFE61906.1 carbohydrate ABC transporter membrane protein 1, CUT1 family (TC 3.A.1.1.-) [Shimia marina]